MLQFRPFNSEPLFYSISSSYNSEFSTCTCGFDSIDDPTYEDKWCCTDGPCHFSDGSTFKSGGTCDNWSEVISLTEMCHSQCNYHASKSLDNVETPGVKGQISPIISKRSFAKACGENSTTCIPERSLCNGKVMCDNWNDLKWCKDSQRLEEDCGLCKYK